MVRRCKKYFYKSSRYLQSRVPQFDSGFHLQFSQIHPSTQTQAKLRILKICIRSIHLPFDSTKMKLKQTSQLLLIDLVLQLLPIAYFAYSLPSFAENGLNGPLVLAAFYLFIIWKVSGGSNAARYLFLAYTFVIFLPLSVMFLMHTSSIGMGLLVLIQIGIKAYCVYQLFFTPTKLEFTKVEEESEFPKF
jgi:hypothetical protein